MVALTKVELCIAEDSAWLTKKQLKLNTEKSEAIVFFQAKQRDILLADVYITVAGHRIQSSSCVRNLGVLFDNNLKMEHQIANTVQKGATIRFEILDKFGHIWPKNHARHLFTH